MNKTRKTQVYSNPRKVEDVSNRPKDPEQIIEEQMDERGVV